MHDDAEHSPPLPLPLPPPPSDSIGDAHLCDDAEAPLSEARRQALASPPDQRHQPGARGPGGETAAPRRGAGGAGGREGGRGGAPAAEEAAGDH